MKKRAKLAILFAFIFCLAGCGSSSYNNDSYKNVQMTGESDRYEYAASDDIYMDAVSEEYYETVNAGAAPAQSTSTENVRDGRKLIRTANLTVETMEFDLFLAQVKAKAENLGGYAEVYNVNNGKGYEYYYDKQNGYRQERSAYIVYRIPKNRVDEFLGSVAETGNVLTRNEQEQDVTSQYVDLESHKKTLLIEQERLMALLEKAETLEDMLTLESRLSDIRYQLESIERNIRTYDSQIEYSTITLNVKEVVELTVMEEEELTNIERMGKGFVDSLKNIWDGIVEFFVEFVIVSPYILLALLLIGIFVLILVLIIKGAIKKGEKKAKAGGALPVQSPAQNTAPAASTKEKEVK